MGPETWDARYAGTAALYGEGPNDFLAAQAGLIPPGPVLCVADGDARNGVWLAGRGHAVTSVDYAAAATARARERAERAGVAIHAVTADLGGFEIAPQTFSGVAWIFCHLPPALRADVLARSLAGLGPGGVLVLEAYTPDQIGRGTGGPPVPELMITAAELRAALVGVEVLLLQEVEREVVEGALHSGLASVVQCVARRAPSPEGP